jgi:hypothetical protein
MAPGSATNRVPFKLQAAALLLAMLMVLALLLVRSAGTEDVPVFLAWSKLAQDHGLVGGYQVMVDRWPETTLGRHWELAGGEYPPLGFAWLYLVAVLADVIGVSHLLMFKVGILVCSFASTLMVWLCCRSLPLTAAFQGATVLSATGLGYLDVVAAPFLIATLWAVREERPVLGFAAFVVGGLLKWQVLLIAPFLLLHVLRITDLRSLGRAFAQSLLWQLVAVTTITVLVLGMLFGDSPALAFLYALRHPFLSGNALNVPWIATLFARLLLSPDFSLGDELVYVELPMAMLLPFKLVFFGLLAWILLRFLRVERCFANLLLFSTLGVVTYGVWNSAVHENHWFMALIPAFLLAGTVRDEAARWVCLLVSVMLNVNLFVFYGITGQEVVSRNVGIDLSIVLALLYIAIWLSLTRYTWSVRPVRSAVFQSAAKPAPV